MKKNWRSPHDRVKQEDTKIKNTALYVAMGATFLAFVAQGIGSYYTGSIALLSDTAHVFTDTFSLAMSLFAVRLSTRPPSHEQSYGMYRSEVMASFLNSLLLLLVAIGVAWEALTRFWHPQEVFALPLILIASAGLALNLISALFLHKAMKSGHQHEHLHEHDHGHDHHDSHMHEDRNLRAALLHVLSDALGSVAVVIGAVIIYYTKMYWVDALIGILLSGLIARWAWKLLRDTTRVLLESTPRHIAIPMLLGELKNTDERIVRVEDIHVWEITTRMYALTADVFVSTMSLSEADQLRANMEVLLMQKYGIAHPTIAVKEFRLVLPNHL